MHEVFGEHIDAAERAGNQSGAQKLRGLWSQFADLALQGEVPVLPARGQPRRRRIEVFPAPRARSSDRVRLNPDIARAAVLSSGMTQGAIAEATGRAQQTVSRWLNGATEIPIEQAVQISALLDSDTSALVREEDVPKVTKWLEEHPPQNPPEVV